MLAFSPMPQTGQPYASHACRYRRTRKKKMRLLFPLSLFGFAPIPSAIPPFFFLSPYRHIRGFQLLRLHAVPLNTPQPERAFTASYPPPQDVFFLARTFAPVYLSVTQSSPCPVSDGLFPRPQPPSHHSYRHLDAFSCLALVVSNAPASPTRFFFVAPFALRSVLPVHGTEKSTLKFPRVFYFTRRCLPPPHRP